LLKPLKSVRDGTPLGGDLKLLNECCKGDIGVTSFIDDEFAYFTSNGTTGVEDLLPLVRFKRKLFGMKGSSNH